MLSIIEKTAILSLLAASVTPELPMNVQLILLPGFLDVLHVVNECCFHGFSELPKGLLDIFSSFGAALEVIDSVCVRQLLGLFLRDDPGFRKIFFVAEEKNAGLFSGCL